MSATTDLVSTPCLQTERPRVVTVVVLALGGYEAASSDSDS
jgi:hypothetical protein